MRGTISAIILVAAGCAQQPVVGVLQPLSGSAQVYGRSVDSGVQVALDEARRRAQLPEGFSLVVEDTASSPTTAVTAFHRLVDDDGARIVLGGVTTDEAYALLPTVDDSRVILLSPSASASELSRQSPYFYRLFPGEELEGMTAARQLVEEMGLSSLVLYTDGSLYTRGVESAFRQHYQLRLGGRIAGSIHLGDDDWQERSADIHHAHHPQAVYIIGYAEHIVEVLEHLSRLRFKGVRCTTSTIDVGEVLERAGDLVEGVVFPLPAFDVGSVAEPVQGFVREYRERFGRQPDIYAAHGYDGMRVAIRALATSSALYTPELQKAIRFELSDLLGVTGVISFNDHGEVARYPVMHCIMDGRVVPLSRVLEWKLQEARETLEGLAPASSRARWTSVVDGRV